MTPTTTVILGGGFGGLAAAHTLRSLLPKEHRITLVDQSPRFYVGATKTWVMLGDRTAEEITRKRDALLPQGVNFLHAEVQRIDPSRGEVVTSSGTLKADFLIIAMGANLNMAAVPGLDQAAQTFYTLDGAVNLRHVLEDFTEGELVMLIPRSPFKCPPAPYEAAMLLHSAFEQKGVRDRIRISIYTVEPAPMPTAGSEMGAFIRELVQTRDIAFHPLKQTKAVDGTRRAIVFEDGSEAKYDLLIAIPPHVAPRVVREAGLTNQAGWVPVDPKTMKVMAAESAIPIYAAGDITSVPLPGRYKPDVPLALPKAGVFAASHGMTAARQIAAAVLGKPVAEVFDGKGFCYIEVGDNQAVKGEGSFFELPHPQMSRHTPDKEQMQDKLQWVKNWLDGKIL